MSCLDVQIGVCGVCTHALSLWFFCHLICECTTTSTLLQTRVFSTLLSSLCVIVELLLVLSLHSLTDNIILFPLFVKKC